MNEFEYEACLGDEACIISVVRSGDVFVVRKNGQPLVSIRKVFGVWESYGRPYENLYSDDIQAIGDEIDNWLENKEKKPR